MPERRERWRRMSGDGYSEGEIRSALEIVDYTVNWLEKDLNETTWIAGDSMSLADIYVLSNIHRVRELYPEKVNPDDFPKINAWRDKLMLRPAAVEAYSTGTPETPPRPDGKSIEGIDCDLEEIMRAR